MPEWTRLSKERGREMRSARSFPVGAPFSRPSSLIRKHAPCVMRRRREGTESRARRRRGLASTRRKRLYLISRARAGLDSTRESARARVACVCALYFDAALGGDVDVHARTLDLDTSSPSSSLTRESAFIQLNHRVQRRTRRAFGHRRDRRARDAFASRRAERRADVCVSGLAYTARRSSRGATPPDFGWGVLMMNRTSNDHHCARALVHSLDATTSLPFTSFIDINSRHRQYVAARTSFCEHRLENTPRVWSDVYSPCSFSHGRRRRRVCRHRSPPSLRFA